MIRKTLRLGAGAALVCGLAALAVGHDLALNVFRSGRVRLASEAQKLVDPEVELAAVFEQLPVASARLKGALKDATTQIAGHARAIAELEATLKLIDRDLETLAPAVRSGSACALRSRRLEPKAARHEAARLLAKRKRYTRDIATRSELVAALKGQQAEIQSQLAATQDAVRRFHEKRASLHTKAELLRAAQRVEALKASVGSGPLSGVPSSLDRIEKRLDERLLTIGERRKLQESAGAAGDEHLASVREQQAAEELDRLFPAAADKEQ